MKNIITTILLLALFAQFIPVAKASEPDNKAVVMAIGNSDMRVVALKNVLEKYDSPLAPYAKSYIDIADKYGIEWELLPAIAGLESTFGKHQLAGSYNSYGWGGGRLYFDSVDDGIDTVLSALKNKYMARGATTVETIAPIYSESATWAPRVRHFMAEIDKEYARLGMHTLDLTI
jgi:hypothetical protein